MVILTPTLGGGGGYINIQFFNGHNGSMVYMSFTVERVNSTFKWFKWEPPY